MCCNFGVRLKRQIAPTNHWQNLNVCKGRPKLQKKARTCKSASYPPPPRPTGGRVRILVYA